MLQKILVLIALAALVSCQNSNSQKEGKETKITQEQQATEKEEPFQTVDSEEEAAQLNQKTETAIEEIEVQDRVFFGYDSSEISEDAKKVLDTQVAWLKSDPSIKIIIEGHCDERGTREYNIALGERRAESARTYLLANGIEAKRVKTISYGKERPAFVGSTEEVFAKNRRAVTIVGE